MQENNVKVDTDSKVTFESGNEQCDMKYYCSWIDEPVKVKCIDLEGKPTSLELSNSLYFT